MGCILNPNIINKTFKVKDIESITLIGSNINSNGVWFKPGIRKKKKKKDDLKMEDKMFKRWMIEDNMVIDTVDGEEFQSMDSAVVHMFNVVYNELQEIKKREID